MNKKKKVISIVMSAALFLLISSGIIINLMHESYLKENTVSFENKQLEDLIRHELSLSDNENIMKKDLDKVTHISFIDKYGVITPSPENLDELLSLKNLEELTLQSLNSKTDTTIFAQLPNLKFLSIYKKVIQNENGEWIETPLENIDFLLQCPKLEKLILVDCGLKDINGLKNITTLKYIELDYNEIEDISVLATLPNLTELDASYNGIVDISALKDIKTLRYINLKNNPVVKEESYDELRKVINERRKKEGLDTLTKKDMGIN